MAAWSLSSVQRDDVKERAAANICAIGWCRGLTIALEDAKATALAIERKAYTAAEVAARTTTGSRPLAETTEAYARKLSELLLEAVKSGGKLEVAGAAAGANAEVVDLSGGSRDFMTKELTEEALAAMLKEGSAVSRIKFSTKSFGREAADVAARAIRNVAGSLTDADISDIIAGRPEDEALDALRCVSAALASCKLRKLNLSDNALGEKGVRACAEAITSQAALEGLSLQNVGCSIHACRATEELLQKAGELRQLHLFNNMSDNEGAEHIARILARAPKMEDFRMASSRVGPRGGIALSQGLAAGTSLVRLDLSDNPMTSAIAPALAACLHQQRSLKYLNLNDTSLGDKGIIQVCAGLAGAAPALEELELALNEVSPKGAKAVALALLGKDRLRRLNLRENELEDKGAVVVAKAVEKVPSLCAIDACGNQLRRVGAVALARAAVGLAGLELLALDENMISDTGLDEVRGVFAAAGKPRALGPLDENMEEESEEGEDEDEEGGGAADELSSALARAGLA